ncbi:proclotting enzyme isoform X1 [Ixodes scapularis]|uniref:proclotting enzyme isoform X1 n=1 Tax=Ixodes scapularis TaxID=6945 RepID=UPI001A9D023D|nr:proclotting enzyme isoform X1 [Ixodes scapularis]
MRLRAHANGALILKFLLVLGSAAAQDAAQDGDKDSGGEEVEKRLLVFPDTNLPDSGSFCQSPLGTSGRCVPYQECRFLFNDEFLARRSLCGFNGRVSLVCCPQQGQGFGNGFGGGLGGGGGGGGIVFPEVPQVPQNFPNIGRPFRPFRPNFNNGFGNPFGAAGGGGGFGPPRRPFGQGGGLPPNRNPFGGGGGQFGGRFPGNHRTPRPSGPYNSPRPQGPRQWGTSNCGVASSALVRIVGGRESNLGAWPWITLLFIDVHGNGVRSPLCGGALITPQHVLTAAHCTFNGNKSLTPDAFVARLGEHDYLSNDDGANPVDEPVVQIHRHSDFNSRTYLNDVAVLKLRRPVPLNKDIALICLPYGPLQTDTYEGKMANIAGWGELYYGGPSSASLQDTRIPIQSLDTCKESFKRTSITFTDNYLCAGSLKGDKDACRGDSGGPLMLLDQQERFTIIGITSFGRRCAEPGYPGVYTRVAKYLDWIAQRLN